MGPKAQLGFHSFIGLSLLHGVCFRLLYVTVHKGVILQLCPTIHQAYSRNMPVLDQVSEGILGLLSSPPRLMGLSNEPGGCPLVPRHVPSFIAMHVTGGGPASASSPRLPRLMRRLPSSGSRPAFLCSTLS